MTRRLRSPLVWFVVAPLIALGWTVSAAHASPLDAVSGLALPSSGALHALQAVGQGMMDQVDSVVGVINGWIEAFFFADVLFFDPDHTLPLAVIWLVMGGIFFTLRMGFVNIRAFKHAVNITRGVYSNPSDPGEVSHFQALSTALSATVGLGNIAGVAIAISVGGPGATFWMIIAGLLGMSLKFAEVTLGQHYREVRPDGKVMGGPMEYLYKGLREKGVGGIGKFLAIFYAVVCIGASLGGGNSFQVNQSLNAMTATFPILATYPWAYGLILMVLVGLVILGGIKRIAGAASRIVPFMAILYVAAAIYILAVNAPAIPGAFGEIIQGAFNPSAALGGIIGVLVQGFRRAAFSNEAGAGSASIAHSAARTAYPVREGVVALLEPFIDTVVICTMTALVIVITGAWDNPAYADLVVANNGAGLTSRAMGEHLTWFPYILSIAVLLFAYSTMISWSYYGERCWAYLFGDKTSKIFQVIFILNVFLGSIITSTNVLNFGDLMILGLAFPNLIGVYILSGKVKQDFDDYWAKYKAGEFKRYK